MFERPKFFIDLMKGVETDIMGAKNVNVSICEILISYSKINENENDFMESQYDFILLMFNK